MALAGKEIVGEDDGRVLVRARAGENWHGFVQWTLAQGLGGLENLSLIPGTVGASPIQNIGAYGVEVKDVFHSLTAFDFASGATRTLDAAACRFGYRDSVFKHEDGRSAGGAGRDLRAAARVDAEPALRRAGARARCAGHRRADAAPGQRRRDRDPPPQAARPGRDRQRRQLLQEPGGDRRALRAPAGNAGRTWSTTRSPTAAKSWPPAG